MKTFPNRRDKLTHKGNYGHLLILGGSPGMTGAVCLAGKAALRCGCGLATIGIPASLNAIIQTKLTETMTLPLPENTAQTFSSKAAEPALDFIEKKADAVLIGPGISLKTKELEGFVKRVVSESVKPVIIDADAIKIIATEKAILKHGPPVILTPHPGEMQHLTGIETKEIQKNRRKTAEAFAKEYGVTLVLKGHHTVISNGQHTCLNLTGNPGMATAGSGDVLAGIIGSLIVQGYSGFEASKHGAFLHGLAGDLAVKDIGETALIASDIISALPLVLRRITLPQKN